MPDRRAGEARDDLDAELRGRPGGVLHPLGGAAAHTLGLAVAPHLGRQDALVARVDRVAHRLAHEVRAQGPAAQPVALEELAAPLGVVGLRQRAVDLEVVAPARELEPVVAPEAQREATSSRVRSAHCPVNRVMGLAMVSSGRGRLAPRHSNRHRPVIDDRAREASSAVGESPARSAHSRVRCGWSA